ncbi:hypothetical protein TNCT_598541 [Trichonephila clavata]|uniref:Uncharacterized protein n=1 Tax=Trichonephila clavata TaxID=2740835 RepID=A0A8X6GC60_TRICU|nr:hypothetical protein TNCT_598541 [Trichonephila clavata]
MRLATSTTTALPGCSTHPRKLQGGRTGPLPNPARDAAAVTLPMLAALYRIHRRRSYDGHPPSVPPLLKLWARHSHVSAEFLVVTAD